MGRKKDNIMGAMRFVLPEHRELYNRIKAEERRYVPPERDEEQLAALSGRIWEARQTGSPVTLVYYDGTQASRLTGTVAHIDQALGKMKLQTEGQTVWIPFSRLLEVELATNS